MACALVNDNKGQVISGVNSLAYPVELAQVAAIAQADRLPVVEAFYQSKIWNQWLAQIESDEVAKRVFDARVNPSPEKGVEFAQKADNSLGGTLVVDGILGPNTVAGINENDPEPFVDAFRSVRSQHYRDIVANNPSDAPYLNAWLARANA